MPEPNLPLQGFVIAALRFMRRTFCILFCAATLSHTACHDSDPAPGTKPRNTEIGAPKGVAAEMPDLPIEFEFDEKKAVKMAEGEIRKLLNDPAFHHEPDEIKKLDLKRPRIAAIINRERNGRKNFAIVVIFSEIQRPEHKGVVTLLKENSQFIPFGRGMTIRSVAEITHGIKSDPEYFGPQD